ncbi:uncharacterized protein LOC118580708 [Onychomys torridus]|uniref:uncharacterized protein LOC118580708 n=1 Tax=Onychomys torridus TaxID=38674 RepID=UPI00167F4A13|nr:uncharacterized protein LOC118580708 [Onychomys torridus]
MPASRGSLTDTASPRRCGSFREDLRDKSRPAPRPARTARAHAALCCPAAAATSGREGPARGAPGEVGCPRPLAPGAKLLPSPRSETPGGLRRAYAGSWRLSLCFGNWQDAITRKSHCPAPDSPDGDRSSFGAGHSDADG